MDEQNPNKSFYTPASPSPSPSSLQCKKMNSDDDDENIQVPYKMEDFRESPASPWGKILPSIVAIGIILLGKFVLFPQSFAEKVFSAMEDDLNEIVKVKEEQFFPMLEQFISDASSYTASEESLYASLEKIQKMASDLTMMFRESEVRFPYGDFSQEEKQKIENYFDLSIAFHEGQEAYLKNVGTCLDMVFAQESDAVSYCLQIDSDWYDVASEYAENVMNTLEMTDEERDAFQEEFFREPEY